MKEFNRNKSKIEKINGKKVISKEHQKLIFLKREEYFYNLFKENSLIKTPLIYDIKELNIKTYFIEGRGKDINLAIKDWAKVHSYFIKNPIKGNKLFIQHNINEVSKYLLQNKDVFNILGKNLECKLREVGLNKKIETLLHGDLTSKNFISSNNENYYFDFELGGIGHPARDIASMIISNPEQRINILNYYKNSFDYNYPGITEDIDNWTLVRASQLYFIFDRRRDGTKKQKNKIRNKLTSIIERLII